MKSISFFFLGLVVWWTTAILLSGETSPHGVAFMAALVLFFGSFYAVPLVAYLACAEALARLLSKFLGLIVFLLLALCGFAALLAVQYFWMEQTHLFRSMDDASLFIRTVLVPSAVVTALYGVRLMRRPTLA